LRNYKLRQPLSPGFTLPAAFRRDSLTPDFFEIIAGITLCTDADNTIANSRNVGIECDPGWLQFLVGTRSNVDKSWKVPIRFDWGVGLRCRRGFDFERVECDLAMSAFVLRLKSEHVGP